MRKLYLLILGSRKPVPGGQARPGSAYNKLGAAACPAKAELQGCALPRYSFLEVRHGWGINPQSSRTGSPP